MFEFRTASSIITEAWDKQIVGVHNNTYCLLYTMQANKQKQISVLAEKLLPTEVHSVHNCNGEPDQTQWVIYSTYKQYTILDA